MIFCMKTINIMLQSISNDSFIQIDLKSIIILVAVLAVSIVLMNFIKRLVLKRIDKDNETVFETAYSFTKWIILTIVFLLSLDTIGVNVTAMLASAAALLVGVGIALQSFFQDIFSGLLVITEKTLKEGDIIEIEGSMVRVEKIKLRYTRAVMLSNKVLIIPNHLFMRRYFYNWTQNGIMTRESIFIRVAHGSNVKLVMSLLEKVAYENEQIEKEPPPLVVFTEISESAYNFELIFTVHDSFNA